MSLLDLQLAGSSARNPGEAWGGRFQSVGWPTLGWARVRGFLHLGKPGDEPISHSAQEKDALKVLLSALACEPQKGSEPEVGFRAMLAAASHHEVWVLTLNDSIPRIEKALQGDPRAVRIHLNGIDFGVKGERFARLTALGFHWHYDRWQRAVATKALELDRKVHFDVVHHVTLASYWTRAGVAMVGKPLVWGPVGGGVDPPLSLISELGPRGMLEGAARTLARPLIARLPWVRRTQRVARVTLAQNPATQRRIQGHGQVRILSNALAVDLDGVLDPGPRTADLLFVGRLLPWKAPILVLRALRYVQHSNAVLRFCGEGPERSRLERAAQRWDLSHRVRFEGWIDRAEVLALLARAGVLIHPAVHEEAGLCIAEALSLGTPVVCLDHGGPPEVVRYWPRTMSALIPAGRPQATARRMAAAIDSFLAHPPTPRATPLLAKASFQEELLRAYEGAASDGP